MNVLILHGIGGQPGIHWQRWLADQIVAQGHQAMLPRLPDTDRPNRRAWLSAAQSTVTSIDSRDLVIVGHSLGVTTALDVLELAPSPVHALISVAGFAEDYGAELNSYFLREKSVDFAKVRSKIAHAAVFYGDNDPYVPAHALAALATDLQVIPHIVKDGGHLNTEAGFTTFPDLLESVITLTNL